MSRDFQMVLIGVFVGMAFLWLVQSWMVRRREKRLQEAVSEFDQPAPPVAGEKPQMVGLVRLRPMPPIEMPPMPKGWRSSKQKLCDADETTRKAIEQINALYDVGPFSVAERLPSEGQPVIFQRVDGRWWSGKFALIDGKPRFGLPGVYFEAVQWIGSVVWKDSDFI